PAERREIGHGVAAAGSRAGRGKRARGHRLCGRDLSPGRRQRTQPSPAAPGCAAVIFPLGSASEARLSHVAAIPLDGYPAAPASISVTTAIFFIASLLVVEPRESSRRARLRFPGRVRVGQLLIVRAPYERSGQVLRIVHDGGENQPGIAVWLERPAEVLGQHRAAPVGYT